MTRFIYLLMSQEEDHWKCGIKGRIKLMRRAVGGIRFSLLRAAVEWLWILRLLSMRRPMGIWGWNSWCFSPFKSWNFVDTDASFLGWLVPVVMMILTLLFPSLFAVFWLGTTVEDLLSVFFVCLFFNQLAVVTSKSRYYRWW